MMLFLFLVLSVTWTANACPGGCFCSQKRKVINCANTDRKSVPDNLPTGFSLLILRYNSFTDLTDKDVATFHRFDLVDLRNNSLNCSKYITRLKTSHILTDCSLKTLAPVSTTVESVLHTRHQPFATSELLKTDPASSKSKTTNVKSRTFRIVFGIILVLVLLAAIFGAYFCWGRKERVVTLEAIELNALTEEVYNTDFSDDEEESTLFVKEKQL